MKYDLVFEGGGAKGMAFVGACAELFGRGHGAGRLLGTSAGAITATLLAAGYSPDEMTAALGEKENGKSVFEGFMGPPLPFTDEEIERGATFSLLGKLDLTLLPGFLENRLDRKIAVALARGERSRHLVALVDRGGWYAADRFVAWLENKLDSGPAAGGGMRHYSRLTLAEFHAATDFDLSLVAADTTDGTMLVLNHRTAPACPVVWAVRMSMSIPLLWDEVVWKGAWGSYRERELTGHMIVDGGTLSNFPLELFLSGEQTVTSVMGPKSGNPVLGLLIDESLDLPSVPRGVFINVNVKPGELATVQRLSRLVDTMMGAHDKRVIEAHGDCIARLPAKGYGTTDFGMSEDRRNALVDAARQAMRAHLDQAPHFRGFAPGDPAPSSPAVDRVARDLLGG